MTGKAYSGFTRTNSVLFDFYKTPGPAVWALLKRERFVGAIWEPCSGDGAISKILEANYDNVISSDIQTARYIYGERGVDFLEQDVRVDNVVTNPPYKLAQEMAEHALKVSRRKVAMLLPLSFLESQRRYRFHIRSPLKAVYVFSKRIRCLTRLQSPILAKVTGIVFAWFVWDHDHEGAPTLGWISPMEIP